MTFSYQNLIKQALKEGKKKKSNALDADSLPEYNLLLAKIHFLVESGSYNPFPEKYKNELLNKETTWGQFACIVRESSTKKLPKQYMPIEI